MILGFSIPLFSFPALAAQDIDAPANDLVSSLSADLSSGLNSISAVNILGGIIFSTIGFAVFIYGKKQVNGKAMILGIILMVYPYLVKSTLAVYGLGILFCGLLYFLREK